MHDAAFVQPRQLRFGQIRDVAGDLFRTEFGIARRNGQFFDVNGGEAILCRNALGDQDRVLVVVTVPRHERDQHVLAEGQFSHIGGSAIRHHVAARDHIAHLDQRTLVDIGVLVGTGVFGQVVDIHTDFAGSCFVVVDAHHDTGGIHVIDTSAAPGLHRRAGVHRHGTLKTGSYQRLFRTQARHGLALHVGAHQGAVGIVMFQERNQRSRHRYHLRRRYVHIFHLVRGSQHEFIVMARRNDVVGEVAFLVQLGIRLGDGELAFFDRRQIIDIVRHLALGDLAVWRFDEAVLVGACIQRQRVDQADVRAFRSFDRAYAAIVGRMHVAHLEAGAFAGQPARSERGDAALVRDFRQGIGLVHELRQLAGAEEFFDRSRDRLGIDQVMRHQVIGLGLPETFLDGTFHAGQAGAELVFGQFTHGAHAAVAEVVDVIDLAVPVAQIDQDLHHCDDVII